MACGRGRERRPARGALAMLLLEVVPVEVFVGGGGAPGGCRLAGVEGVLGATDIGPSTSRSGEPGAWAYMEQTEPAGEGALRFIRVAERKSLLDGRPGGVSRALRWRARDAGGEREEERKKCKLERVPTLTKLRLGFSVHQRLVAAKLRVAPTTAEFIAATVYYESVHTLNRNLKSSELSIRSIDRN